MSILKKPMTVFKCWTERDRKTKKGGEGKKGEGNKGKERGREERRNKENEERENSIYNSNSVYSIFSFFYNDHLLLFSNNDYGENYNCKVYFRIF